ncbi:MAG TPA: CDP-glycerol glycerophosphotransferase family protein [Kofleriaceae bacterium]|nr:CDP-glycerol glycerophosphotransferase family protein [Kofleriaceae bacterium]
MTARVLFTGHSHAHVVCFRPLYEYLRARGDVHVFVSGGIPVAPEGRPGPRPDVTDPVGVRLDARAMARPFYIPRERIVSVEEMAAMDVDILFATDSRMLRPRSVGCHVQLFPGLSFRSEAIRSSADAFFLVGPTMRRRLATAGLLPAGDRRAFDIGAPWTDRLVDGSLERDVLLRWYGLDGDRPILLYAPTGQKGNSLELMGEEVLARLDETDRYLVLVKPHRVTPERRTDWTARLRSYPWRNVVVLDDVDMIPPLHMADLLITDASSIASEYALLDRPMVFLDVPQLVARVVAAAGTELDLASWARGAGTVISSPDEVAAAVANGLAHPRARSAVRRATAADFFYNPGRATRAATAWLDQKLRRARTAA